MRRNYKIYGKDETYLMLSTRAKMNYTYVSNYYEIREYREYSYNGRTCAYIYRWAIMFDGQRVAFFDKGEAVEKFFSNPKVLTSVPKSM